MSDRQITSDERYIIARLRQHRFNWAEIANILGRHRSSISRECRRNRSAGDGPYRPGTGAECAGGRRTRSRRNSQCTVDDWRLVERLLSTRPAAAETRTTIRHWGVDTVVGVGAKDCVATVVERKTGFTMLGKLADRSSRGMTRRLRRLIRRAPQRFDTVTADDGSEFHDYTAVGAATGVTFYFATPYHSWERGTNENLNGLPRQYLPKRSHGHHTISIHRRLQCERWIYLCHNSI